MARSTEELLEHRAASLRGLAKALDALDDEELSRLWVGAICEMLPTVEGLPSALAVVKRRLTVLGLSLDRLRGGGDRYLARERALWRLHVRLPNVGDAVRFVDFFANTQQRSRARVTALQWVHSSPHFTIERRPVPLSDNPDALRRRASAQQRGGQRPRKLELWLVRVRPGTMTTMATHTTNPVTVLSETASVPAAAGDNNLVANPTGHTFILIRNADGALDSTVTIAAVATMRPAEPHRWPQTVVPNIVVLCPAGQMRLIGPIPEAYNDASGLAHLSFSSVVNVSLIAFSTPR